MPSSNFPYGVSATTSVRTVAGEVYCDTLVTTGATSIGGATTISGALVVGGAVSFSTAATMVGERALITGSFTSAATTTYYSTPFAGNIISCITTCDTTPRVCSGFTLRAGSAGSVAVASVACTFATAIGQQISPTLTPISITTASAINITVTTAGSAANFGFTLVLQRTA